MAEKKLGLDKEWTEAAPRCRLSAADVHMTKDLGFKPRSLLKNVPPPQHLESRWLSGSDLYAKRERRSEQPRRRRETVNTASPGHGCRSDAARRLLTTHQQRFSATSWNMRLVNCGTAVYIVHGMRIPSHTASTS
jgi:hypothetical protein